jgi:hypothetical protein
MRSTWLIDSNHLNQSISDRRGEDLVAQVTGGLTAQNALLVSQLEWDQDDALLYASRHGHSDLAWVRLTEVLPHFPYLVRDNHAIGRDVVLTAGAATTVVAAYGGILPVEQDAASTARRLADVVRTMPPGSPYVLSVLTPIASQAHDAADLDSVLGQLTGGRIQTTSGAPYEVLAGVSQTAPAFHLSSRRPFHQRLSLLGDAFTLRMDAWLPTDTFRRGGFGHVLRDRERVLFIERGVSLVWFAANGTPQVVYAAGPYAPEPRFRIPVQRTRLASADPSSPAAEWYRDGVPPGLR